MTLCVNLSNNFIIAKLGILSGGASIFTIVHSPGLRITFSFGNNGNDLFKSENSTLVELNTPSNSNMFLIPSTKSTLPWISETKVYISNLCPAISTITRMMKSTVTYFHCLLEFSIYLMLI